MEWIVMNSNLRWFKDAKFGMFIHWGLYSLPSGIWKSQEMEYIGEWLQAKFRIPNAEYAKLAAEFNPVGFDAEEWVLAAKNAGMKYLVFTAKHADGFAMYHSKCSRFNIVDATPFGRDVLAELAAACGKYGVKLGIYYSQSLDWHEPDGADPGIDARAGNFGMSWGNDWDFPDLSTKVFSRYFSGKVIPQLKELLTNYGPISILWFDNSNLTKKQSERLVSLIKKIQPECLVNSRIGNGLGDFGTLGDNQLPSARRDGAWETPGTMNDTWGFKHNDHNWKSPRDIVQLLVALADKDANYLLNVGPRGDGRFPDAAARALQDVGAWMKSYGGCVHGSSGNPFPYDFDWGHMTVSTGVAGRFARLNLILRGHSFGVVTLQGLKDRVRRCYELSQPEADLPFTVSETGGVNMLHLEADGICDSLLPVLAVELDTERYPAVEQRLITQGGHLWLKPVQGRLIHGRIAMVAANRGVSAAGEQLTGSEHSCVDGSGRLVEWHNPADSIEWDVVFLEPGDYLVELVLTARRHSAPWIDGQTVKLAYESGDRSFVWEATLSGSPLDTAASRCYAEGSTAAGTLSVKRSGAGKLSLTMLAPGCPAAVGMALTEVRLARR